MQPDAGATSTKTGTAFIGLQRSEAPSLPDPAVQRPPVNVAGSGAHSAASLLASCAHWGLHAVQIDSGHNQPQSDEVHPRPCTITAEKSQGNRGVGNYVPRNQLEGMVQVVAVWLGARTTGPAYHRSWFFFYDAGYTIFIFGERMALLDCAQHFLFKSNVRR